MLSEHHVSLRWQRWERWFDIRYGGFMMSIGLIGFVVTNACIRLSQMMAREEIAYL